MGYITKRDSPENGLSLGVIRQGATLIRTVGIAAADEDRPEFVHAWRRIVRSVVRLMCQHVDAFVYVISIWATVVTENYVYIVSTQLMQ